MSNRTFEGRVALVTGGVRRVGFEIAQALAREGAALLLTYHSSQPDEVRNAIEKLLAAGASSVSAYPCDLRSSDSLNELVTTLDREQVAIDFLINSAASFLHASLPNTTPAQFDETMALNVRAPFFLAQYCGLRMKDAGFGRIVNIADVAGVNPFPGYLAYSVSKAAVIALTKGLAKALAPEVLVNCVAPGPVLPPENFSAAEVRAAVEPTLLKRAGSADEVARTVIHLLQSDYITGVTLPVDGGRLLR